jgi:hypothetical protein
MLDKERRKITRDYFQEKKKKTLSKALELFSFYG